MTFSENEAVLLFLALVALYSPVASISAYIPVLQPFNRAQRLRLALRLTANVAVIAVVSVWLGEPLLRLFGLTTAALTVTGGIALILNAIPLMRGTSVTSVEPADVSGADPKKAAKPASWKSIVFMPLTFPLTLGGATVAIMIGFRAQVDGFVPVLELTAAALAYALVTGICVYIAGHLELHMSAGARNILNRVAGILLTAIAVTLLANGFTKLVTIALHSGTSY